MTENLEASPAPAPPKPAIPADLDASVALTHTELLERLLAPVPNPVTAPYVRGVRRG